MSALGFNELTNSSTASFQMKPVMPLAKGFVAVSYHFGETAWGYRAKHIC